MELTAFGNSVELNVGIIAASLPCLRPLFDMLFKKQAPTTMKSEKQYATHPYTLTLNQNRGSHYLQSHTLTHISGGSGGLKDATSSEEKMILPTIYTEISIVKDINS